ncbi:MAG: D-alanyl-D-alanine carboxypeptidase [Akkermansia sp.]|nr:D-alanyl-D-alanine carboxypeptidase [Akkermansia sp.]
MRFLALLLTICTLIAATAPAGAFVRQNQPMTGHKPAPIPQGARHVRRPYHSSLNPSRPLRTPETPAPRPDCAAVCVIDPYNGNVLYGYNANTRRQVASTQKIITALCVCDTKNLDKMVTIKASDRLAPPIRLNLKAGEQYSRRDLLQAMLTGSFNDVAVSLARDCAGSVEAFVARMNARAKRMRMHNTHFANPNGLPAQQYSTAYDMALAACYAYNNKTIRGMINIPAYELRRNDGSMRMIRSTNRLLTSHPWVQGMKTGYTNLAGKCLISCASSGGRAVIVVVLGSTSRKIWGESLKYLRWALYNA